MVLINNELQSCNIKWKIKIIDNTLEIKLKKILTLSRTTIIYSRWEANKKKIF